MKKLTFAALLLSAACATAPDTAPAPAVAPPTQGSALAEMQVTMTELLERLDVLNDRIARLENAQSEMRSVTQVTPAPATAQPPAASARAAVPQSAAIRGAEIASRYREALTLFAKKQYSDARTAFQAVFDADAEGDLADNALFWIGETYYSAGDYNNALRFYRRVTADFANQNKAPDALLKTALALEKTGDLALAKTTLEQVASRYPYSSAAGTARKELERIRF